MQNRYLDMEDTKKLSALQHLVKEINIFQHQAFYKEAFGGVLGNSVESLYKMQPGGEKNYGRGNPDIGLVYLYQDRESECYDRETEGYEKLPLNDASIKCILKEDLSKKDVTFVSLLDLNKKNWMKAPKWAKLPEILKKDTEKVMKHLGLKLKK